jgi:hypothetical protein
MVRLALAPPLAGPMFDRRKIRSQSDSLMENEHE